MNEAAKKFVNAIHDASMSIGSAAQVDDFVAAVQLELGVIRGERQEACEIMGVVLNMVCWTDAVTMGEVTNLIKAALK